MFRQTERDGISAIKFEAARTETLLRDDFVPQVPSQERELKLRHVFYEVWRVIFSSRSGDFSSIFVVNRNVCPLAIPESSAFNVSLPISGKSFIAI